MDTNKKMFKDLKKETMLYNINWNRYDNEALPYDQIAKVIGFVADSKKQMDLGIQEISMKDLYCLNLIANRFCEIIIVTSDELYYDIFDFKLFNNIPYVSLCGFRGVKSISEGLENIKVLLLQLDDLESIHDISRGGNLKRLKISFCSKLHRIEGVCENDIMKTILDPRIQRKCFEFRDSPINFSRLTVERMFIFLSPEHLRECNIVVFSQIHTLEIHSVVGARIPKVSFTSRSLTLRDFDLSEWSHDVEFQFLHELKLLYCTNVTNLPSMPKIKRLTVLHVSSLESIPTFPTLKHLVIVHCSSFRELMPQPKLLHFEIVSKTSFIDFSALDGQTFLSVVCDGLLDANPFRNAYHLSFSYSANVRNIGRAASSLLSSRRSLIFRKTILDNRSLNNLFRLELSQINLSSVEIKNIAHLELNSCTGLFNTTNIQNITQSLTLKYCNDLVSLSNLQNIPRVNLHCLPNVKDISGLGYHDHLNISCVPFLQDLIIAYASHERFRVAIVEAEGYSSRIFSTIKTVRVNLPTTGKPTRLW